MCSLLWVQCTLQLRICGLIEVCVVAYLLMVRFLFGFVLILMANISIAVLVCRSGFTV